MSPSVHLSPRRLVTARIWFWQARAARKAGWFVRRPGKSGGHLRWYDFLRSPRFTIARFFRFDAPVKAEYRLDGNLAEMVADLGGGAGELERPSLIDRGLHHLVMAVKPVSYDVTESFIREHGKAVDRGCNAGCLIPRGLSLNECLYLVGHPQPVHSFSSEYLAFDKRLRARIEARQRRDSDGAAA